MLGRKVHSASSSFSRSLRSVLSLSCTPAQALVPSGQMSGAIPSTGAGSGLDQLTNLLTLSNAVSDCWRQAPRVQASRNCCQVRGRNLLPASQHALHAAQARQVANLRLV